MKTDKNKIALVERIVEASIKQIPEDFQKNYYSKISWMLEGFKKELKIKYSENMEKWIKLFEEVLSEMPKSH